MTRFVPALLVLCGFCLTGCGDGATGAANRLPVFPVSGKITYKNAPVADADVTFMNEEKNISGYARTDAQGMFKVTTYSPNDGAVAGKHKVSVKKIQINAPTKKEAPLDSPEYVPPSPDAVVVAPPPTQLVPAKYADITTTDLIVVVTEGANPEVPLELKD